MNDTSSGGTTAGTAITTYHYAHKHFTLLLLANPWLGVILKEVINCCLCLKTLIILNRDAQRVIS